MYRLEKGGVKYILLPLKVAINTKDCKVEGHGFVVKKVQNMKYESGHTVRQAVFCAGQLK